MRPYKFRATFLYHAKKVKKQELENCLQNKSLFSLHAKPQTLFPPLENRYRRVGEEGLIV